MRHLLSALIVGVFLLPLDKAYTQDWVQKGSDINGKLSNEMFGVSVSMNNDGNRMAIGAGDTLEYLSPGYVQVYEWIESDWRQKGNDIDGFINNEYVGVKVKLSSDGNTVAIRALWDDGDLSPVGLVRIYQWNGDKWIQKGSDIDADRDLDRSGVSVSMDLSSDANTLAIGSTDDNDNGVEAGNVRIYEWNGSDWVQKGTDIDGEAAGDNSGISVNMSSDGNIVAIGAPGNDGTGNNAGHVRIYEWGGNGWIQKGSDIDGEAAGDQSGVSIGLSADGNIVAIGAMENNDAGNDAGHVRVYQWDGSVWFQKGIDIDGEAAGDHSGGAVSLSSNGNKLAIGAVRNNDSGNHSGHVRIYKWNGNMWAQNGNDINGNGAGDHLGTAIDLSSDGDMLAVTGFASNWSGRVRIYSKPCPPTSSTISASACDSYLSPSGKHMWTNSGTYKDTIQNKAGCDSIITVNLTIDNSTKETISSTVCDSFISPSGKYSWTSSGIYKDTIPNAVGCDSVITVDLTVNNSTARTVYPVVCDSYTSSSGKYTWTSSGIYKDTIPNTVGCDSVITFDLTIKNSTTSTISPVVCDSYTSPSGKYIWTSSGLYEDVIPNSAGCDSVITVDLTVNSIDNSTTVSGSTITANQNNVEYQWIDCDQGKTTIAGETDQEFIASVNGNYAVEITRNGCVDTSACVNVEIVGIEQKTFTDNINLYPNPSSGSIKIKLEKQFPRLQIRVRDVKGNIVEHHKFIDEDNIYLDIEGEKGIYLVKLSFQNKNTTMKVVKN